MDAPRACTTCAAPAEPRQRWCLECGAELPQSRRGALRPAVGIATTLAVLVGAASAGGYTILHRESPPQAPATTVAQQAPTAPATIAPSAAGTPSVGGSPYAGTTPYSAPSTYGTTPPLASPSNPTHYATKPEAGKTGGATPAHTTPTHTTTQTQPSGGSVTETSPTHTTTTAQKPQMALANVALGAVAVAYAPYASPTTDLGDPSQVDDGSTRTAWRTPTFADPATSPQMGVYIDLATSQQLRKLTLDTPTPGMGIEIYGATQGPPASITDKGWDHLATRRSLDRTTTIGLPARSYRYVLVWITSLPPNAHGAAISEIGLWSLQPE